MVLNAIGDYFFSGYGSVEPSVDEVSKGFKNFFNCFEPFAGMVSGSLLKTAAELSDVVDLSEDFKYTACYEGGQVSGGDEVLSLKWESSLPRFEPSNLSELYSEGELPAAFMKDIMRADYIFSRQSESGELYTTQLAQESPEERIAFLRSQGISEADLVQIAGVAHQGHLAETAVQALTCSSSDGGHVFVQADASLRHEIELNVDGSACIRSSTQYVAKNTMTEQRVCGLSLITAVTTRIGVNNGRLDHQILGAEETLMACELRYTKGQEEESEWASKNDWVLV